METDIKTKTCSCCGKEKPLNEFRRHHRTADGYANVCNECRTNHAIKSEGNSRIQPQYHEELSAFPPRSLMEHLAALGYKGNLQIPHNIML